ncbi:dihydrodipicolinate synthase [Mycobacterium sp. WUMAC-067]|uniref:dihydrodipicolinate synthase n=1 Tax=unclassified Mycobacterium TaxID=2642494 RepID=UPI001CDA15A6|nr:MULTISPECIES: dihydrodipicolinate synthase [unclassified Mycobacterium]MCA2244766.1 dihydrodipicolinate synthase [Mycobacterium sp. WUMAC-067]MCA2315976.1 dihydrodipicolinate synthase [Mycobacterium sp. WUMAC-025]
MTVRVIQWATGPVGLAQLREVIDRPELELVGVLVYSETKVGLDAGALVDRPATGVCATADQGAIFALEADVVLHAASKAGTVDTNVDDIVALLSSGKNVITTTSYNHLPSCSRAIADRITAACRTGGSRFFAAGEHPGFVFERLATAVTALSQHVDCITVQEFVDCSEISERGMLVDLMGMGKQPDEITVESPMFSAVSLQYEQALGGAADVLNCRIDSIERSIETVTASQDVVLRCATLKARTVVGQKLCWTAYQQGKPVLVAEEYWSAASDIPQWSSQLAGQFRVRITVTGVPSMQLDLEIGNGIVPGLANVSQGQLAVAMTAVRAIGDVMASPAGRVVIPRVFGVYQWPES